MHLILEMSSIISSNTCSKESAMTRKFHQKVISYSYYERSIPNPGKRNYFDGIAKNLHAIKKYYGLSWSMRLYLKMSTISDSQKKILCQFTCTEPGRLGAQLFTSLTTD